MGKPDEEARIATQLRPSDEPQPPKPGTVPLREPLAEEAKVTPSGRYVDPVIGSDVAGYRVKQRLGVGGMGIVYEGEHAVIGKRVAIKVLRPELADNPQVIERLVAEARAVNQVGHRGIIDVFGYGQLPDGRQCIVMEYLEGQALSDLLFDNQKHGRAMPEPQVLGLLEEILSALSAAHGAGVIHRDLKPSNIYICRQRDGGRFVKLLDFGIAKLGALGGASPQDRASMMVGTPSYMAPEQALGNAATPAMDLYAVGVVAFELLTNRLPFVAESVVEVLLMHGKEPVPRPSSVMPGISGGADELVLRLMSKRPEERYPSAEHVRARVLALKVGMADPTATPTVRVETPAPAPPPDSERRLVYPWPTRPPAPVETRPVPREPPPTTPMPAPNALTPEPEFLRKGPGLGTAVVVGLVLVLGAAVGALLLGASDEPQKVEPAKPKPSPARGGVAPPPPPSPAPGPAPEPVAVEPAPPPRVEVVPQPSPSPPPAKPARAAKATPAVRLDRLEHRMARARANGQDTELYERQVKKVRERLGAPMSDDDREQLEAVIGRLEHSDAF